MKLVEWFPAVRGHQFVPLFETDESLLAVQTRVQKSGRRLLRRSATMEAAVIEYVETGLKDTAWQGLLYVMGWGTASTFQPLYAGKAERKGTKHEVSNNLTRIRSNFAFFARWGDDTARHVGALSQALFDFASYQPPARKYKRWVDALFDSKDPPRLKQPVSLFLAPWTDGCAGPSGLRGSLPAVEKEVIALASEQFPDTLLNEDGT